MMKSKSILPAIYARYPAVKEYVRSHNIPGECLEDPKVVFNKISIACLRREIQYIASEEHVARNQYLNSGSASYNAYEAIRLEIGASSGSPDYLVVRILGYRTSD